MKSAVALTLLTLTALLHSVAAQGDEPSFPTSAGTNSGNFRILIRRPDSAGVFSGDFGSGSGNNTDKLANLDRSYTGTNVPVEVFDVSQNANNDSANLTPAQLCQYLQQQNPDVTTCEPDFQVSIDQFTGAPDDPDYTQQYSLQRVNVQQVWDSGNFGSANVKVCVIDTGTDLLHPDIRDNLWINPEERAGAGATEANGLVNGKDDDNNGIIDDIHGADFLSGSSDGDVQDQNGHGTFVAGVIGAITNNAIGIAGMNQQVQIMTCRFMDASGNGWISDAIRCVDYCISKGAHIMSNSWGGVDYSDSLQAAVNQATDKGVLFVASAGNKGDDTDVVKHYPSTLPDGIVLAVAASDRTGALWRFSNYGAQTVDIAAPGVQVLGLGLGGAYVSLTGTSMATPHISGCAALILAQFEKNGFDIDSGLGPQVKRILLSTTTPLGGGTGKVANGILDCYAALQRVPSSASAAGGRGGGGFGSNESTGAIEVFSGDFGASPTSPTPVADPTLPITTAAGGGLDQAAEIVNVWTNGAVAAESTSSSQQGRRRLAERWSQNWFDSWVRHKA